MRGRIVSAALAATLAFTLGWAAPLLESLVVVRDGSTFSVPVAEERGYPAARAGALADALGYAYAGNGIRMEGESVRFTAGSPFFAVGEQIYQLANPAYASGSQLMIPASWALEWLPTQRPRLWSYMDGRLVARPLVTMQPPDRDTWLVVVDPGHGGRDPGTVGVAGTREKDVVLAVAKQLASRLRRANDIEVVLTRDRDTLIAFADRPRVLQLSGRQTMPDLFISIHANSMPRKPHSARGFETYFLAIARTSEALQVALRENASLQFEEGGSEADLDPLQFMLTDLQSTANLQESRVLATSINRSMAATLNAPDLGVKQGPFQVLVGATMPAVLVEVGYLSNSAEERQLRSSSYQAKIADALADAVVNYLADYGQRVWSSHSSGG